MKADDFEKFAELITDAMAFYEKSITAFGMKVWWNALSMDDLCDIEAAIVRYMTAPETARFAPKPINIMEALDALPSPKWCLDAGFSNRWEAANSRCSRNNAHQFRNGKKVEE